MNLWTEYEGRTVAGDYYLETLLRSEGRSAFFKTHGKADANAVIRLTEAHFDEDEMLARWRQVAAVEQSNLIEIRTVGQTTLDGVALTYALLEPSDASLAEVLGERPLTTSETLQVAKALVSALSALHRNGLVHEHIEPANVLAVDETVKLRSDCVRQCVVDMEFSTAEDCAELRRKDVRDVGVLLLQCLTQGKEWRPTLALAAPFNQLIPGAIDGGWTLERMENVLNPPARPLPRTSGIVAGLAVSPVPEAAGPPAAAPAGGVAGLVEPRASLVPESVLQRASVAAQPLEQAAQKVVEPAVQFRARNDAGLLQHRRGAVPQWVVYAAAAVMVVLVGWLFFGRSSRPAAAKAPAAAAAVAAANAGIAKPSAAQTLTSRAVTAAPATQRAGWRVVAYTYNHEDQAAGKVKQLRRTHVSLQPQVFSPSGHAPYYVTLGGAMDNKEATSVLRRAQQNGLPRDTFMRNY
jgi:hypothetical protein